MSTLVDLDACSKAEETGTLFRLGGGLGSGAAATYGFVPGTGVTSFIPLAVAGHTSWDGVHFPGQR